MTLPATDNKDMTDMQLKGLLKDIKTLKNLTNVSFVGCKQITDDGITAAINGLKDMKKLQVLFLGGTKLTDAGLKEIAQLKKIQDLGLGKTKITDESLKSVRQLGNLQKLFLADTSITDKGLKELKEAKNLQKLVVVGCSNITKTGIDDLKMSSPRLQISGREDLALSIDEAAAFKSIQDLGGEIEIFDGSVTSVSFSQVSVTDKWLGIALKNLSALKNLRSLSLPNGANVTDESLREILKVLKELKKLRILNLDDTNITDASLMSLSEIKGLQQLSLNNVKITDAGLIKLKHITNLWELCLANTSVTDAGLKRLGEFKKLRRLIISGCIDVSDEGIDDLKKSLPKLQILR